jgi:uncharacterized protein (TIGR03086 family)
VDHAADQTNGTDDDATARVLDRWTRVASACSTVVDHVPVDAWERPAPCDGWVARDVVEHLVSWVPSVLGPSGVDFDRIAESSGTAARWHAFADSITAALQDPACATTEFDAGPPGRMRVDAAIDMLVTGDVLVHTWDLAAATGQHIELDPEVVHDMLVGMQPMDEMLRSSGHFGPKVVVADDADETTQLLAFCGRDVARWT